MKKLAVLLIASALFSPAFSEEAKVPARQEGTKTVATHKPKARKLAKVSDKAKKAKKPVVQSTQSSLRSLDFPWQIPS